MKALFKTKIQAFIVIALMLTFGCENNDYQDNPPKCEDGDRVCIGSESWTCITGDWQFVQDCSAASERICYDGFCHFIEDGTGKFDESQETNDDEIEIQENDQFSDNENFANASDDDSVEKDQNDEEFSDENYDDNFEEESYDSDDKLLTDQESEEITEEEHTNDCQSGVCCSPEGYFLQNTTRCSNKVLRRCKDEGVCNSKVEKMTQEIFCSGASSSCDGQEKNSIWTTAETCDTGESCKDGYCEQDSNCVEKTCEFIEHFYDLGARTSADKVFNGEEERWVTIYCNDPDASCMGYINRKDGGHSTGCTGGNAVFNYSGTFKFECSGKTTYPANVTTKLVCGSSQHACTSSYSSSNGYLTVNCNVNVGTANCPSGFKPMFVLTINGRIYIENPAIQSAACK